MLETLMAERYDGDAIGGATEPSKMECRRRDGTMVDVFVKCSSPQCPPGGLVREVVSALLAEALAIPAAKPALVFVEQTLQDQIHVISPATCLRIRNSVTPMYGSVALGTGYSLCLPGAALGASALRSATEIWAFDQLMLNPDRNARKPNCMLKGDDLVMIDHEKALMVAGLGSFLLPAPWHEQWVPDGSHLFNDLVQRNPLGLERLQSAWLSVDDERLEGFLSCVPKSWEAGEVVGSIGRYLAELHANLDMAFKNLMKVMS